MSANRVLVLGLMLCLGCGSAYAKSHLNRDELKIISASTVQVMYFDTGVPIAPYLDANHRAIAIGGLQGAIADDVNQSRMDELSRRLLPYKATLDKLDLPDANYQLTQASLASVVWLNKSPWVRLQRQSNQDFFIRDHIKQAKAQIVIFIGPQVLMAVNTRQLLMSWSIDIETADPATGKTSHYEESEFTAEVDIDPAALPPRASTPREDEDDDDVHVEQMLIDGGAGLKSLLAKLTPQYQQQLYYFFTGNDVAPPVTNTGAPEKPPEPIDRASRP